MKKIIYFAVLLFLVLIPNNIVNADCSDSEIIRLQRIANNVNYNYIYDENTHEFKIIITNLTKEIIIHDYKESKDYNLNGELNIVKRVPGDYKFAIYSKDKLCYNSTIITRNISLPYYNGYYNMDVCKDIENYGYCAKWFKTGISNETIVSKINNYRKKIVKEEKTTTYQESNVDKIKKMITEIYSKYYFIILPIIILIFGIPVYIKERNSQLV